NERGRVVTEAQRGYPVSMPHAGWSEQDPEQWWQATRAVLTELDAPVADEIALTAQMHGLVALDADRRPLRPAILWNDGRSQPQADEIERRLGGPRLVQPSGNPGVAGFTAAQR